MPDTTRSIPATPAVRMPSIDEIEGILASRRSHVVPDTGELRAGVLIPLIGAGDEYDCLLTQRTDLVEHHKGQVSFPGGAADRGDADIIATALRETHEEVGIDPADVRVVGMLDEFRTHTGFIVTPVVGYLPKLPDLTIQRDEVAEAFTAPLRFFADGGNMTSDKRLIDGMLREVYFFRYRGFLIWGITARIIRDFVGLLDDARPSA